VGLSLVVGPANAGKVALLLDRYLEAIDRDPVLVVPTGADVEPVERDLLRRSGALLGGSVGTFDDVFESIARGETGASARPARGRIRPSQRRLLLARVVARGSLDGLAASARFPGFTTALAEAIRDAESALLEADDVGGPFGELYRAYRAELDRLGLWDRELERAHAAQLVAGELRAWDGRPVFAYGFEDLTGVQWALLEALAGRVEVTVSLPYEPGRAVFASLERTAGDLAGLADARIVELPAQDSYDAPALAYLERVLFEDTASDGSRAGRAPGQRNGDAGAASSTGPDEAPPLHGAVRFLEAAGSRAALELVAEDVIELLRAGTPPEEIAVVCPAVERQRAPLEAAFGALGVPYAVEGSVPVERTPFGRALLALLRFAWHGGPRRHLFLFLRSRYSGFPRSRADFVEGRLRGRAVSDPARVEEEAVRLLGHPLRALDDVRGAPTAADAVRAAADLMLRAAYGLEAPPTGAAPGLDLRVHEAVYEVARELDGWAGLGFDVGREHALSTLADAQVRVARAREPGRVAVLDLLRARTRRFAAVFVVGLEEGSFPRRAAETPFLPDDDRRALEEAVPRRRLVRADVLARERYLFYTACTRAWQRLTLVREAATDDGRPQEPSPFYEEVRSRFAPDEVARWTRRRPLSALTWDADRAPTERERLRATASLAAVDADEARGLARANGWERRIDRALAAFSRPTRLTHPTVLRQLQETTRFSVTELETFGTCSSMWLFDRIVNPKEIDAELDARLRGAVVHQALYRFYAGLPKRLGVERVEGERLDDARAFLRECLAEAISGQVKIDVSDVDRLELEGTLARDLEHFLRQEVELGFPLVPRRFEVLFGTPGAPVELQRGVDLGDFTVSGKIDRIDLDPMSARGIVQDYKSGAGAHSAAQIESEGKLQVPLYLLALRDLVGIEPLGGLYRALAGSREARGLVRADAREDAVPGIKSADYLDEAEFWGHVDRAVARARESVGRLRAGDVRHDPRGGTCPSWCERWTMCRIPRP
jgi:PD-(D/E)XK nuclease superfamily